MFIAPQEYMLRPPQPAVYLILLDVSHSAVETGYLEIVCQVCESICCILFFIDKSIGRL